MKRMLMVVAVALMFLNTLVVPTVAHADGGAGGKAARRLASRSLWSRVTKSEHK